MGRPGFVGEGGDQLLKEYVLTTLGERVLVREVRTSGRRHPNYTATLLSTSGEVSVVDAQSHEELALVIAVAVESFVTALTLRRAALTGADQSRVLG
jgi:hypothetical protein